MQHIDPIGVAARDLKECLLIQVHQCTAFAEPAGGNHIVPIWTLLRNHNYAELAKRLKMPASDEVETWVDHIHHLDPLPGRQSQRL